MLSMFLWKATKDREKWRQGKNTISRVTGRSNAIFYMNKNNTWTRDTCFHRMKRFVSMKLLLAGFKRTLFWQNHWHFQRTEGFNCSRCGNKVISNSFSITPVEAFEPNKYHEINKKSNILYQELHDVDYFQRRKPVYLQNLLLCNVSEAHIVWINLIRRYLCQKELDEPSFEIFVSFCDAFLVQRFSAEILLDCAWY